MMTLKWMAVFLGLILASLRLGLRPRQLLPALGASGIAIVCALLHGVYDGASWNVIAEASVICAGIGYFAALFALYRDAITPTVSQGAAWTLSLTFLYFLEPLLRMDRVPSPAM